MNPSRVILLLVVAAIAGTSCSTHKQEAQSVVVSFPKSGPRPAVSSALPKAIAYKTEGDYLDNIPVQLTADGNLISFPAPSDIPSDAAPVKLADGWLLSRIGVGPRSVFTRWTIDEYRSLAQVPAPQEILKAVIPGSGVTATLTLPMTLTEALADTAAVNRFILANHR